MWAKPHYPSGPWAMQPCSEGGDPALSHYRGSSAQCPAATQLEGAQGTLNLAGFLPPSHPPERPSSNTKAQEQTEKDPALETAWGVMRSTWPHFSTWTWPWAPEPCPHTRSGSKPALQSCMQRTCGKRLRAWSCCSMWHQHWDLPAAEWLSGPSIWRLHLAGVWLYGGVMPGLTLRMHTLCSANITLCCPAAAPPQPCSCYLGTHPLSRTERQLRDRAAYSVRQGVEEAARGYSAAFLPQLGHGQCYGWETGLLFTSC